MIGIGPFEIGVVLLVLLLVVGPERMPEIVRFLSRVLREVRSAASEMRDQVEQLTELDAVKRDVEQVSSSIRNAGVREDLLLDAGAAPPRVAEPTPRSEAAVPPAASSAPEIEAAASDSGAGGAESEGSASEAAHRE